MSDDGIRPSEEERRRQRGRSIAIGFVLAGLVVLFYLVTLVKLGPGIVERAL